MSARRAIRNAPPASCAISVFTKRRRRRTFRRRLTLRQHVGHRIEAGFLPREPLGGAHRAARKDAARRRAVRKLDSLAGAGEHHLVQSDLVAAAQHGKADVAGLARTGSAVARTSALLAEIDFAAGGGGTAERQRRARRRVHLIAM